jgi:anti-sigma factor RsiW
VDGGAGIEAAATTAHVASCPLCTERVAEMRLLKSRMRLYASSSRTASPPHLVERALGRALPGERTAGKTPGRLRLAAQTAVLVLLGFIVIASVLYFARPVALVPVDRLLAEAPRAVVPAVDSFETSDPSRAAEWMRSRLKAEVAPVSLSLARAQLIGARHRVSERSGEFVYRDLRGRIVSLYIYPGRRLESAGFERIDFRGQTYRMKANPGSGLVAAFWTGEALEYAAVGSMSQRELLPLAHEMARRCR